MSVSITPGATALTVTWSKQNDFVGSTIIGVNSVSQLEEILPAANLQLEADVLERIDEITRKHMYPLG